MSKTIHTTEEEKEKYEYKHLLRLANMVVIWKATLHVLSCCVIFNHGHVPTWIKDSSLFNNLLSLREMFLSAPHSLATPALKRPPVCLHVHNTPSPRQSCHGRSWLCDDDSFIKEPHLITLKSGHMDTQEERLLYGSRRIPAPRPITNHSSVPTALHSREQDFNLYKLQVLTTKRFASTWCVRADLINLFMY